MFSALVILTAKLLIEEANDSSIKMEPIFQEGLMGLIPLSCPCLLQVLPILSWVLFSSSSWPGGFPVPLPLVRFIPFWAPLWKLTELLRVLEPGW